jgi:hypothetical protein
VPERPEENYTSVVAMGTTVGVGPLIDGDRVEIEVEGVGRLEHGVEARAGGVRRPRG